MPTQRLSIPGVMDVRCTADKKSNARSGSATALGVIIGVAAGKLEASLDTLPTTRGHERIGSDDCKMRKRQFFKVLIGALSGRIPNVSRFAAHASGGISPDTIGHQGEEQRPEFQNRQFGGLCRLTICQKAFERG